MVRTANRHRHQRGPIHAQRIQSRLHRHKSTVNQLEQRFSISVRGVQSSCLCAENEGRSCSQRNSEGSNLYV
eukprot:86838-Rhodomonas_salina.6